MSKVKIEDVIAVLLITVFICLLVLGTLNDGIPALVRYLFGFHFGVFLMRYLYRRFGVMP